MENYSSSFILDCTFWIYDRLIPMQILFATKAKATGAIFLHRKQSDRCNFFCTESKATGAIFFAPKAKRQVQFFLYRKQSDRCNFFCTESKATGADALSVCISNERLPNKQISKFLLYQNALFDETNFCPSLLL